MGDLLFFKHELSAVIDNQRKKLIEELDRVSDQQLLNTTASDLQSYAVEKYCIDLPQLGEPIVDQKRTKITVGRFGEDYGYGGRDSGIQVDAERFTLEVPYTGDEILFWCRGSTWNSSPPQGSVNPRLVSTAVTLREPNAEKINNEFERFIRDLEQWLEFLRPDVDRWNASIRAVVDSHVGERRKRAEKASSAAAGLKFALKARSDAAATYTAPVSPRKIAPVLPPASKGSAPEPVLTDEAYREIVDTFQQMSEVMERSPHAFAAMDEETLRFQFLVPLNAKFEGEARGETFNYGGKTDILITHKGRNIFVAELKVWSGAKALGEAIDQLLGYLSWRDTKTALIVFNRNRNFSAVLEQIDEAVRTHSNFVAAGPKRGATEFRYTMKQRDDPARQLTMTVLAFDLPSERSR